MTVEQGIVYAVILMILIVPMFKRWRYDLVALLGLLLLIIVEIISPEEAFAGYGHPAVVTVAAVLVCSRGLQNSGVVDLLARWLSIAGDRLSFQLAALCGLAALSSAFMNNVGALAIFMPVAIRMAHKSQRSPALYLMPLAFSAHFGGMMTLIGTPPNIIIATLRTEHVGEPFGMFDFAPLGLGVAFFSILFIATVGWRLIPQRKGGASTKGLFKIEDYFSEVRVPPEAKLAGQPVQELQEVTAADVLIVGILRGDERLPAPSGLEVIHPEDVLLVRTNAENLRQFIQEARLELAESKPVTAEALQSSQIGIVEAVIHPGSVLVHKTARELNLRWRYGVNLLAVSRHGARLRAPLGSIQLLVGDVLLLQLRRPTMAETLERLGCLPLAMRGIKLGQPRRVLLSTGIFGAAMIAAALGLLPVQVTMTLAACAMIVAGLLTLHEAYESVDWPIIILLGAMIPLGLAMENTGGAQLIANQILHFSDMLPPVAVLVILLLVTMFLSDLVNNAAAVVLMASIALSVAEGLGVSPDPFLVAVAIAGSCAFLTPIGHQSNVMVLEPGSYEFGDYWRLGLPLELIIVAVAVPLLLWLWPL
ncbi:MAG: SLC13 family permease [Anaerolineales bacterium]